jgi:predicted Zn-dependent peptidase
MFHETNVQGVKEFTEKPELEADIFYKEKGQILREISAKNEFISV